MGLLVIVDHGGYMSLYAHNEQLYKAVGDRVEGGRGDRDGGGYRGPQPARPVPRNSPWGQACRPGSLVPAAIPLVGAAASYKLPITSKTGGGP